MENPATSFVEMSRVDEALESTQSIGLLITWKQSKIHVSTLEEARLAAEFITQLEHLC